MGEVQKGMARRSWFLDVANVGITNNICHSLLRIGYTNCSDRNIMEHSITSITRFPFCHDILFRNDRWTAFIQLWYFLFPYSPIEKPNVDLKSPKQELQFRTNWSVIDYFARWFNFGTFSSTGSYIFELPIKFINYSKFYSNVDGRCLTHNASARIRMANSRRSGHCCECCHVNVILL